jgi:uncharacterized protein (TIGR03000 family)
MKSTKVQALLVLASAVLLGCVAASGNFLRGRQADAGPASGSQGDAAEVIVFVVRLPADALLMIDDDKTTSTGEERRFRTPPLHVGGHYSYTLKATSNGKEVTRTIQLAHGADNTFDLRPAFGAVTAKQPERSKLAAPPGSRPNIIFVICDQESYHLTARSDYQLPARRALMRHGVTFRNHYIASAMCTPSRAAFLTGQPPQVNGVFDQMEYSFQPSLSPDRPNM